jgi:hypothetical protein
MYIKNIFIRFLITLISVCILHSSSVTQARVEHGLLPRNANPGNTQSLQGPADPVRLVPNGVLPRRYRISPPYCSRAGGRGNSYEDLQILQRCRQICICGGKPGNPDQLRCKSRFSSSPPSYAAQCPKFCECGALAESLRRASSTYQIPPGEGLTGGSGGAGIQRDQREKPQTLAELIQNWPTEPTS